MRRLIAIPALPNQKLIVIFTGLILLARSWTGKSCGELVFFLLPGALAGTGLAQAIQYIVLAANGGTYSNSVTKASVLLALSCPTLFAVTVFRFTRPKWAFSGLICSLVLALTLCGGYRQPAASIWKLPFYYLIFLSIAALYAELVSLLVFPLPAGRLAREALASGISSTGQRLAEAVDLLTGAVNPSTGLLAAISGEEDPCLGVDAALLEVVRPWHMAAGQAGCQLQVRGCCGGCPARICQ